VIDLPVESMTEVNGLLFSRLLAWVEKLVPLSTNNLGTRNKIDTVLTLHCILIYTSLGYTVKHSLECISTAAIAATETGYTRMWEGMRSFLVPKAFREVVWFEILSKE
jgi:hypothetical protein